MCDLTRGGSRHAELCLSLIISLHVREPGRNNLSADLGQAKGEQAGPKRHFMVVRCDSILGNLNPGDQWNNRMTNAWPAPFLLPHNSSSCQFHPCLVLLIHFENLGL